MKKTITTALIAALALSIAACGSNTGTTQTTAAAVSEAAATAVSEAAAETENQESDAQASGEAEAAAETEATEGGAQASEEADAAADESSSEVGNGGAVDKSSDTELQTMIEEVAPKFELMTFEDEETGTSLQYQLYIPEDYDPSQSYPLVQFIPDSSVVGKGTDAVLTQGWGGLIWATEEEQAKHPSFVVIPVFTETVVNDNAEHSDQVDVAVRLLQSLAGEYSIDTDRIYTTGQSMGGMTSFYLNTAYPDLFAASLFVGSQWDNSQLTVLEDKDFFYIVAAGDPRASEGQTGLLELFDTDGISYSHEEWSAQDPAETQNAAVEAMLAEGNRANFVTFTEGSTLADSSSSNSMMGEHMTSFDYAYKIEAVRDWLFAQSKTEAVK